MGDTTKLSFEDGKLKTKGEVLMENDITSLKIEKNENNYDRCVIACGDASMTMHRGALYDATIFTGPVTCEGSFEAGDLGQPVTVVGNLHVNGQVTAGNLMVDSEILPSDVAFDSVQVDQAITAAIANISDTISAPIVQATTEVNTKKVTADDNVHTKSLTGLETISAVGGLLTTLDHIEMAGAYMK